MKNVFLIIVLCLVVAAVTFELCLVVAAVTSWAVELRPATPAVRIVADPKIEDRVKALEAKVKILEPAVKTIEEHLQRRGSRY